MWENWEAVFITNAQVEVSELVTSKNTTMSQRVEATACRPEEKSGMKEPTTFGPERTCGRALENSKTVSNESR